MYKIMNNTKHAFIVASKGVFKGGVKFNNDKEVRIDPGQSIYEVDDETGKALSSYQGIVIVEKVEDKVKKNTKKKVVVADENEEDDTDTTAGNGPNPDDLNPDGTPKTEKV